MPGSCCKRRCLLVEDFAVEGLLLHVGLPSPSVLLVGERNCVAEPAGRITGRGTNTTPTDGVWREAVVQHICTSYASTFFYSSHHERHKKTDTTKRMPTPVTTSQWWIAIMHVRGALYGVSVDGDGSTIQQDCTCGGISSCWHFVRLSRRLGVIPAMCPGMDVLLRNLCCNCT